MLTSLSLHKRCLSRLPAGRVDWDYGWTSGLLGFCLSDFFTDMLSKITNPFPFVGLGWFDRSELSRHCPDLLSINSLDGDQRLLSHLHLNSRWNRVKNRVRKPQS